jgi:hypothetical protein
LKVYSAFGLAIRRKGLLLTVFLDPELAGWSRRDEFMNKGGHLRLKAIAG